MLFEALDQQVIEETKEAFIAEGNPSLFAVLLAAKRARESARSGDMDAAKYNLSQSAGILLSAVARERELRDGLPGDDEIMNEALACPSPVSLQVAVRSVYMHDPRGAMTVAGIAPVFRALDDMSVKMLR